jgi:hypothetical protein
LLVRPGPAAVLDHLERRRSDLSALWNSPNETGGDERFRYQ